MPDEDGITQMLNRINDFSESDTFLSLDGETRLKIMRDTAKLVREFDDAERHGWPDAALTAWLAKADQFIAEYNIP